MSISSEMAVRKTNNYKLLNEKLAEIKKEDAAGLIYALNKLCKRADTIDKNGEAAEAILTFLDFVPHKSELRLRCYNALYDRLHQFLSKNSALEIIDEADKKKALAVFIQECANYRRNFDYTPTLPLYYQHVKEFLTKKVADPDIKEAISEFIDTKYHEIADKENLYSTLLSRVIDFNIGNISKEVFIKILKSPTISQDNFTKKRIIAATIDITTPEITTSEITALEITAPEITAPEITTPEATTPEITTPEITTSEITTLEITAPEITTPEITTPETITPIAAPVNKYVSEGDRATYHSYPEEIVFSPAKKEKESNGMQESKFTEYTDSSKETGEIKFLNTGKDWVRNCKNIHLIIDNEEKTFLDWIQLLKPNFQSSKYKPKVESSIDDLYVSMADMTDNEKAIFMLDFIAAMKIRLANKLRLTELTQEQTNFIENAIALVHQQAFGYKMQTELYATLMKSNRAIAENGKNHDVTVHIELEHNEIIIIEKGFFVLKDANKVSYMEKTKLEPNIDGVKATSFIRSLSDTDKISYVRHIEPAVVLMSPRETIKKQQSLIHNPRFSSERKVILSVLDSFLNELNGNSEQKNKAEIASKKNWLKKKLYKMKNALLFISEQKNDDFSSQIALVLEEIDTPKKLEDLETFDTFFSALYTDLGGTVIDYPSYQSIAEQVAKIKASLESDSISEHDLLIARKEVMEFERYIFPNKSVALETLISSLETFRKRHFEPKHYLRTEARKPIPLQENEDSTKQGQPISKQRSMPAVYSEASSSIIRRRKDTVSMFSPERNTIRGDNRDEASSTLPISTPQQKRKSREKEVPPSDLYTFRSFMG